MDDVNMLRRELAFTRNTIRDMEKAMREYADKTGRILDYRAIEIARLRSMLARLVPVPAHEMFARAGAGEDN